MRKYRIYKAAIGWNVVCPCGGWMEKAMTFEGAVRVFEQMLKNKTC
jgi:hypothetical protein